MKQLATLLLCLFLGSTLTSATPYYPNGIPNIGPLKGEITFWGGEGENEEHFDGTGYEAKYDIKLPTKEVVKITISAEITNYQKSGTKSTHSFSIQNNIKEFTGEFNLCILNPNEEVIKKNYKGSLNVPDTGTYFTNYKPFDFSEATENAKIALELIVTDGKAIYVVLGKQPTKDLLFIAKSFPDSN